ncbi:hypothetical protein J7E87_25445 [Streptomyces sp. ISL-1]|uniref:hypothetical protein n=1 Tax=Streptomyces sp. ISL-1 TaxID=2817657 RepID=UPI001BEBE83B|nr:hypothetical protein [Streptomyces sp. ISL-1]MBT2392685.1 hypothetical protein [Streptomyces sp. ISL-1]
MRVSKIASTLIAPSLAIAVLGVGSPAFAADPTPTATEAPAETTPPAQPEESDLAEVGGGDTSAPPPAEGPGKPPTDVPPAQPCEPGWRWASTKKYKDYHKGVGAEQANYNGTGRTARSEFISEVSGEVGIAVSGKLKVGGSVAVAEIELEYGVELSVKLTARLGNKITVDTPSRYTTHARYGVFRLKTAGYNQYVYANCTKGTKENATLYTPRRIGWAIWETK